MATGAAAFVCLGDEAEDPAALRFSVTHNINHFIEVGQILLEIHLKRGGARRPEVDSTPENCRRAPGISGKVDR